MPLGIMRISSLIASVLAAVALLSAACSSRLTVGDEGTEWAQCPMTVDSLLSVAAWSAGDTVSVVAKASRSAAPDKIVLGDVGTGCKLMVHTEDVEVAEDVVGENVVIRGVLCEKRTSKEEVVKQQQDLEALKENGQLSPGAFTTTNNDLAAKIAYMDFRGMDYFSEFYLVGLDYAYVGD